MTISPEPLTTYGLRVEQRQFRDPSGLTVDIVNHVRSRQGRLVIVTDKPEVLLSLTRKRWLKAFRSLKRERASTLDAVKILQLTDEMSWMLGISFSAKATPSYLESIQADVLFATAEKLERFAPECRVLYVTCAIPKEALYRVTAWMPKRGLVVIYR